MRVAPALLAASFCAACSSGEAASPSLPEPFDLAPRGDDGGGAIDLSPLRRLSDTEYLNALGDLFPTLHPALPELPPDVPVAGFDNAAAGQEPSDVLIARYEAIANLYAQAATADDASVRALTGCTDWSTADLAASCATLFISNVGLRIFRRPLTTDETQRHLTRFQSWQASVDFPGAVQLTLSAMLQSPQFIYRPEPAPGGALAGSTVPLASYALATRLSFFLWQSIPDDALLQAASQGTLQTDDGLQTQVARMLGDPRARRVLWSFHRQWMGLDTIMLPEGAMRSPSVDPGWTTTTQADALTESELFVENVLTQGGTFRDLLTSPSAWVNGEMARVYGLPAPAQPAAWAQVMLPASQRAGLLTRVAFLAGYSHAAATSPPVRGNAIALRLLCQLPVSPPPGADLSQPTVPPDSGPQTNRMLFEERTSPPACQACHAQLNGFGFGLESYNAAGAWQTTDDGLPVDPTGVVMGTDVNGPFDGGIELSERLASSAAVHRCATEEWVRFAMGRPPAGSEQALIGQLAHTFLSSQGDVHGLIVSLVHSPIFRTMVVEGK
jgi:hypothetical protein